MPHADGSALAFDGHVSPPFAPVRNAFVATFEQNQELGAAVAVYYRGKLVVDLAGGLYARGSEKAPLQGNLPKPPPAFLFQAPIHQWATYIDRRTWTALGFICIFRSGGLLSDLERNNGFGSLLSVATKNQGLVNKHSKQPTAELSFVLEPRRMATSSAPTIFDRVSRPRT